MNTLDYLCRRVLAGARLSERIHRSISTVIGMTAGACLLISSQLSAADWYLHADQAPTSDWHTLADWWSTPMNDDSSASHPTSISSSDRFFTNGHLLRTPIGYTAETFDGGALVLSGGNVLIKDVSTSTVTTFPNLVAQGGHDRTITTSANGTQHIDVGTLTLTNPDETTSFVTGSSSKDQDITMGTLQGTGTLCFTGGGTAWFSITDISDFYGRIHVTGNSTLDVENDLTMAGSLVIEAGSELLLDQDVTVSALRVNGTTNGADQEVGYVDLASDTTYSFAQLNTAYPSIFPSGSGSITVTHPEIVVDASEVLRDVYLGEFGVCSATKFWEKREPDYRQEMINANIGIVRIVGYPEQDGNGTLEELDTKVAQIINAGAVPLFIQCIDNPTNNPDFYDALFDEDGNLGTGGTPDTNMAFLVKRYAAPPFNLTTQYWEIGNEPDISISYKVSSTAEYIDFFQDAHNTLIAEGVREKVRLCGPVVAAEIGSSVNGGWTDAIMEDFLEACGSPLNGYNQVDVVTRHVYPYIYSWETSPDISMTAYNYLNASAETLTLTHAQNDRWPARGEGALHELMRQAGLPDYVGTGITEMNVASSFRHTITQALWFLSHNHYALQNPRHELGTGFLYDQTSNELCFFNSAKERSYGYWASYIHGVLTGNEVLQQYSTDPHLLVTATQDDYHVYVQVLNRNTSAVSSDVDISNASITGSATMFRISSTDTPDAANSTTLGTSFNYTFPAMTATIFRYDRSDAPPAPPGPPPAPSNVVLDTDFNSAPSGMQTYYTGWQPTISGGDLQLTDTTPNMASAVIFDGQALSASQDRAQIQFGFKVVHNYADGFVFAAYSSDPGGEGSVGHGLGYHGQPNQLWALKVDNNPDQFALLGSQTTSAVDGWCTQALEPYYGQDHFVVIDYEGADGYVRARLYQGTDDTGTLIADITNYVGNPSTLPAGAVFGFTGGTSNFSQDTLIHDLEIRTGNAASTAFVTGQTLSTAVQNNYDGWLGFKFTVGSSDLTVSELGRWVRVGNTGTHTVKLVEASTGQDVAGGSVSIDASAAATGAFAYESLAAPIVLSANTEYYLLSHEPVGGDYYHNYSTVLQHTGVATINCAAFGRGTPSGWRTFGSVGNSYVPVSFKYE